MGILIHGYFILIHFCLLSDKQRDLLWNKLSEVNTIIIDEISMVSSVLIFRLSRWLIELYGCDSQKAFSGLPVIVCANVYQLPSVNGAPIYLANKITKDLVIIWAGRAGRSHA